MGLFRRAPRAHAESTVSEQTLAGAHEHGRDGFSGMVPASTPGPLTDPDRGISEQLAHQVVVTEAQGGADLAPIPGRVDRPLYGGLRAAPAYGTLQTRPAFDGSHVQIKGRAALVILTAPELMSPEAPPALPSMRVPPPDDPLGRACANAAVLAARGDQT